MLTEALNRAIQTALNLDAETKNELAGLRGKCFCLQFIAPNATLYLIPDPDGLRVEERSLKDPDVTVTGTFLSFAKMGLGQSSMTDGDIRIEGDAESAQQLQKVLKNLDLDWEELIARIIGDSPARKAGNVIRGFSEWLSETVDLSRENTADYFKEEKKILVTDVAMKQFEQSVGELRRDVDRTAGKIAALKEKLLKD